MTEAAMAAGPEIGPESGSEIGAAANLRLSEAPDWRYLLRDFEDVYRRGSAGGSAVIRRHLRRVRETLSKIVETDPPLIAKAPSVKPVCAHLPRALDLGRFGPLGSMVRTVERLGPQLHWEYGYEKMPKALAKRYAYAELMGPTGPVVAESLILGLVLFAPGTVYPQHAHAEIEESYVSLSGAWSENDAAVYAPGSLILNRSAQEHRLTVGDRAPCLLAYAWVGPPARLAAPGMSFARKREAKKAG
jgi:dimethylpropiothetin dethiomethylase